MSNPSKSTLKSQINSEYRKKLKDLEAKIAKKHKELNEIERLLKHDTKRVDHSGIAELKSEKGRLNSAILNLKREIKKANKERVKKLKKL